MSPLAAPTVAPIGVEQGATYVFIGPDGTRAVVNDTTDPDFVGFLNEPPTGLERAAVRESADELPEADGGVHGVFLYGRLGFGFKGIITAEHGIKSWAARQDAMMRATDAMRADALLQWQPEEFDQPVQVAFRQQQPTRLTGRRPKEFTVVGVSEHSGIYSAELHVEDIQAPVAQVLGGLASPLVSPLASVPNTGAVATILNAGRSATWPVIDFRGPCLNPFIRNDDLGQTIYLLWELAAGEHLIVDTNPRRRRIMLAGVNRYRALDRTRSAWWPLIAGYNQVRWGASTFGLGAGAELAYRDAWG